MGDFRSLKVWEKAHRLTLEVYQVTAPFPADERLGLMSRIRRSAASLPANFPEGCGRISDRELGRFRRIALGSENELAYRLFLVRDLGMSGRGGVSGPLPRHRGAPEDAGVLRRLPLN